MADTEAMDLVNQEIILKLVDSLTHSLTHSVSQSVNQVAMFRKSRYTPIKTKTHSHPLQLQHCKKSPTAPTKKAGSTSKQIRSIAREAPEL